MRVNSGTHAPEEYGARINPTSKIHLKASDAESPIAVPPEEQSEDHRMNSLTGSPDIAALLAHAEVLSETLAAASSDVDRERRLPHEAMRALRTTGLVGLRVPKEFGGAGGTWEHVVQLYITLARGDSNVAQAFLAHNVFIERLRLMGHREQQARFLGMAARGSLFGGAAAERGGHFRGEVSTQLRVESDHFRLDGIKHYCTGALYADMLKIRALDPDGALVAVLIPVDRGGITLEDDWDGMGQRLTASGTTVLQNVRVNADEIVPMTPWTTRRHHTGAAAQIIHCAIEVGISLAALRDAVSWAREKTRPVRESGVTRASDDPYILREIGRISALAHTAEALVLDAAAALERAARARFDRDDAGHAVVSNAVAEAFAIEASLATAQAKIVSTETALTVTQAMYDVGGASMTARRHNLDRHWRNARTHTTHDPVAYKCRALGNHLVNAVPPPLTFSY